MDPWVEKELQFQQECLAEEMTGNFLGPMNPQAFLDSFLPKATILCPNAEGAFRKIDDLLRKTEDFGEQEMCQPFMDAVTAFAPGLDFIKTSGSPDEDCQIAGVGITPDVSLYAPDSDRKDVTGFATIEIHGKFKTNKAHDPFRDDDAQFEHSSRDSWVTMGQMISYTVAQFSMQFRTCIFSFGIFGSNARIIRWDRSGAIVTESFSYLDTPQILAEFFWRYSHAPPAARGQDMTVETLPLNENYDLARCSLGLRDTRLVRIKVYDDNHPTAAPAEYISATPQFTVRSIIGPATRTFRAWDTQHKRVVLLKDTWRVDLPGIEKEGSTYSRLAERQVPHIPTFLRAGDIPDAHHATRTHTLVNQFPPERREPNRELRDWIRDMLDARGDNRKRPPTPRTNDSGEIVRPHRNYRLIISTSGKDLTNFSSTKELVFAVRDAAVAHGHAWDNAEILHNDISPDNIMITAEGRGILINWDLAKPKSSLMTVQRQFERTAALQGKWQFVSAALLRVPESPHQLADDLESFFLSLIWTLLRFSGSNLWPEKLEHLLNGVFDNGHIGSDGLSYGGMVKKPYLASNQITETLFESEPVTALMQDLSPPFSARYSDSVGLPPRKRPFMTADEFARSLRVWEAAQELRKLRIEKLNTTQWFVAVLDEALSTLPWPSNDKAEIRALVSGRKKRQSDAEPNVANAPRQQKRLKVREEAHVLLFTKRHKS